MQTFEVDPARAWVAAFVAGVAALVAGAVAFPRLVWDRFIWHYFWGPVQADAEGAACAVIENGAVELLGSDACSEATQAGRIVAEPGYTLVSEVGYMIVLLFMLVGVWLLLRRLGVAEDRDLYFALVPFMLFGGALRVVEDSFIAAQFAGVEPAVTYPWSALLISPVIYFTVFVITLVALVASVKLEDTGVVENSHRALGAAGVGVLALTVGYLTSLALSTDYVHWYPQVLLLTVGIATILSLAVWQGADRVWPEVNAGTERIGLGVIWAHAIDGVANVIAGDWAVALGLPSNYYAKHPANRFVIDVTEAIQPAAISEAIGTSWPFLVVKIAVAVAILSLFDDQFIEESPRYALLLLIAVTAVGLGPGTRDMLRVTFGI
ncbi:MAG: DUF63 family protein [Haloarculaceae archaeon]